ncbi:MAG TPA: hypothetical protein VMF58_14185 [Rhizomicrobium sp.]|nr:hypothetical protein [Rhizomicrobium sp.]
MTASLKTVLLAGGAAFALLGAVAHADPMTTAQAKAYFADAKAVSDAEGGRLWGQRLYGAMLLVDPETRIAIANEPDAQGVLHATDGVYVGKLPDDVIISNTPTDWEGKRWTMLMGFTIPDDTVSRHITFAHEMFHRIQPSLHLMAQDSPNPQLDTLEGRVWLQLEWRALAAALIESGAAQDAALRDALAFRDHRHALFANSKASEASLEIAEGIPEFTGVTAGEADVHAARWHAAAKLAHPDTSMSFVRSFSYTSGPGYGLLLEEWAPGWRAKLNERSDLGDLLAATLKASPPVDVDARAALYGASEIRSAEKDRAALADAEKARYRALLIDGPVLALGAPGHFSFNPSTLVSLGDAGNVYPTFHAVAPWGTLDVKAGVLVTDDFSAATVAAPTKTDGQHIEGPGYTIDLAPGWKIVPAAKAGSFMLRK